VPKRILYGTLLTAAMTAILLLDAWVAGRTPPPAAAAWTWRLLRAGTITAGLFTLIALAGGLELGRLLKGMGHRPAIGWGCLAIVALIAAPWAASLSAIDEAARAGLEARLTLGLLFVAVAGTGLAVLVRRDPAGGAMGVATSIVMFVYVGLLGSFAVRLRCQLPGSTGVWMVLCWLAVTKLTDIGAYFTGVLWGRTKLIPAVSPGKTVEGLVGGILLAVVGSALAGWIGDIMALEQRVWPWPAWPGSLVFGLLIALVGQLGDLMESLFKRAADRKDSGAVVPAFGGVLDLMDSPLLTAPLAWWVLTSPPTG
jgi:phosphatidate cytidylyltransferase